MNGSAWNGAQGNVTISSEGQCLTNPARYDGSADDGRLVFLPCNDDGTQYGLRQMWWITKNANGAGQIASNLMYQLPGISNPQRECMEQPTPGAVKRSPCYLNNWWAWF